MSSLIRQFFTHEYTVVRMGKGSYVEGNFVAGPREEIKVWGSMQPMNPRELKLPEEGNRLRQYFKFYTDRPIFVNSERTLADSDKIVVNGDVYRAMSVEHWEGLQVKMPHYKTIIYREPEQYSDGKGDMP